MRHLVPLFAAVALVACAASSGSAGDEAPGAVVAGAAFAPIALPTLAGAEARVPDPTGNYVVLELIRSADW